jgi:death-on-curing protein
MFEMAAAYLFHLVLNHPFIDGNKRVGTVAAFVFLEMNDTEVVVPEDTLEELVRNVAQGLIDKKAVADFFRGHHI